MLDQFGNEYYWSLHLLSGRPEFQAALFAVAAVFALMLIFGWRTRLATIVSWTLLVSLGNRNMLILNSGDVAFRLILFWAMFIPWGEWWSIDALIKAGRAKLDKHKFVPRTSYFSVASFAFILQLALLYWFSVIFKSGDAWVSDYTALYLTLSLDHFTTRAGYIIYMMPELMRFLTFAVIRWEIIGPILFFVPIFRGLFRTVAALGFVFMHFSFAIFMELGIFPFVMATFAFGIVGPFFWEDVLPQLADWIERPTKAVRSHLAILSTSIVNRMGDIPTRLKHQWNSWIEDRIENYQPLKLSMRWQLVRDLIIDTVVGGLIIYTLLWNLTSIPGNENKFPTQISSIGHFLRIDQKWNMFSPYPFLNDGWHITEATLQDGSVIDLFREGQPIDYEKPELVSALYPNQRWRKYMFNIYDESHSYARSSYLKYACEDWNYHHPLNKAEEVKLIYMKETTLLDYKSSPIIPTTLETRRCQ